MLLLFIGKRKKRLTFNLYNASSIKVDETSYYENNKYVIIMRLFESNLLPRKQEILLFFLWNLYRLYKVGIFEYPETYAEVFYEPLFLFCFPQYYFNDSVLYCLINKFYLKINFNSESQIVLKKKLFYIIIRVVRIFK